MPNLFYALLNNSTAAELESIVAADYVPSNFRPVNPHPLAVLARKAILGTDLQSQQYWITRIRQLLLKSPVRFNLKLENIEGGYAIYEIGQELRRYFDPVMESGVAEHFGRLRGDEYQLETFRLTAQGTDLVALKNNQPIYTSPFVGDIAKLVIDPVQETGVSVNIEDTPNTLRWAYRPKQTLVERYREVLPQIRPFLEAAIEIPSTLSPGSISHLVSASQLDVQSNVACLAAAVLLAGHLAAAAEVPYEL